MGKALMNLATAAVEEALAEGADAATLAERAVNAHAAMRIACGSTLQGFNETIARQVFSTLWPLGPDEEAQGTAHEAAIAALHGIAPRDEVEGMLAAQMVATYAAAMEAYRRAMLPNQFADQRNDNLTQANKLVRSYGMLLETLNRHRGKGSEQKVTVEHIHVHNGAQAVIAPVFEGGRHGEIEGQPLAPALAHEHRAALPSPDAAQDRVPVPRGARKAAVPDARRRAR